MKKNTIKTELNTNLFLIKNICYQQIFHDKLYETKYCSEFSKDDMNLIKNKCLNY